MARSTWYCGREIFGSELGITTDPTVPQHKYECHSHIQSLPTLLDRVGRQRHRTGITSFFPHVNDGEVDESQQIIEHQRKTAPKAFQEQPTQGPNQRSQYRLQTSSHSDIDTLDSQLHTDMEICLLFSQ
jgi:hypothetical protein